MTRIAVLTEPTEFATLQCPECGKRSREAMPTNACLYFYRCKGCGTLLKPQQGDCCVFCSYGDKRCPPRSVFAPGLERTLWRLPHTAGLAELRIHYSTALGWSIELYMNGRFLVSQRCHTEAEAIHLAGELRRQWSSAGATKADGQTRRGASEPAPD
jgi:hypothetical protein